MVGFTIFFVANTTATDARATTMDNVVINGNSGTVDVGEGDEEEEERVGEVVGEDEPEVEVASTVPLTSLWAMGSEVPPGA